jgi:hypothetical protein
MGFAAVEIENGGGSMVGCFDGIRFFLFLATYSNFLQKRLTERT